MPSPHSLYSLRLILIVSAYFYVDANCFGLFRVVSSWLRVGSVEVDSFGWVFVDGFRWFQVVCCFCSYASRPLFRWWRWLDMLFLWGLYEQQRSHFFFLILISTNEHSTFSGGLSGAELQILDWGWGGVEGQIQIGTFSYHKYESGIKESNDSPSC